MCRNHCRYCSQYFNETFFVKTLFGQCFSLWVSRTSVSDPTCTFPFMWSMWIMFVFPLPGLSSIFPFLTVLMSKKKLFCKFTINNSNHDDPIPAPPSDNIIYYYLNKILHKFRKRFKKMELNKKKQRYWMALPH